MSDPAEQTQSEIDAAYIDIVVTDTVSRFHRYIEPGIADFQAKAWEALAHRCLALMRDVQQETKP